MKISKIFGLKKTQHELDFVDVDTSRDKSLFIDPFFLSTRQDPWSINSSRTVKSFFQLAIDLIRNNKINEAKHLFSYLHEPNETCLGLSKFKPQGRGVGPDNSEMIFNSLLESKAIETGLVEDLEDTAIFIDGIDRDKVSDMTTNIIRWHLLQYTINQCNLWNISLTKDVPSGFYWDSSNKKWEATHLERLVIDDKPFLLVPKIAVSFWKEYTNQKYYQHDILNFLQGEHLKNKSGLVRQRKLKDGSINEFVTKKDIKDRDAKYSKEFIRNFTKNHPEIFEKFKSNTGKNVKAVCNIDLEEIDINKLIDYLKNSLPKIPKGPESASKYHSTILGILEFIFYPNLCNPIKEREINEGRKRIDITFDNSDDSGYFFQLHNSQNIPSRYIFIECKNYTSDLKNPEYDQLSGRLSVNTGMFGILVCRDIADKKLMLNHCKDLWKQKNELIICITDNEINLFLDSLTDKNSNVINKYFADIQREIILS